jgi:hypothetical protein
MKWNQRGVADGRAKPTGNGKSFFIGKFGGVDQHRSAANQLQSLLYAA